MRGTATVIVSCVKSWPLSWALLKLPKTILLVTTEIPPPSSTPTMFLCTSNEPNKSGFTFLISTLAPKTSKTDLYQSTSSSSLSKFSTTLRLKLCVKHMAIKLKGVITQSFCCLLMISCAKSDMSSFSLWINSCTCNGFKLCMLRSSLVSNHFLADTGSPKFTYIFPWFSFTIFNDFTKACKHLNYGISAI